MKKLSIIGLSLLLMISLISCTNNEKTLTGDLKGILDKVTKDLPMETKIETVKITDENFSSFFFVEPPKEYEAYCSMAMMSAVAHNVSIIRVKEGTDVEKMVKDIEANMDPRKWICVEAEKTKVLSRDNVILVLMSTTETVDKAAENFKAL